jgi:ribosomal protein L30
MGSDCCCCSKKIRVRQVCSSIRRPGKQRLYLLSLGLGRIGAERVMCKSPSVLGLLSKVHHLIVVCDEVSCG